MILENVFFLMFWNIKSAFKVAEFHPKILKVLVFHDFL